MTGFETTLVRPRPAALRRRLPRLPLRRAVAAVTAALALTLTLAGQPALAQGEAFQTSVPAAFLMDLNTGSVLYEKNADQQIQPGTLVKVMTAAVVFAELKAGKITLDTPFIVSVDAWRRGGGPSGTAAMFAEVKKPIAVRELLAGAIVVSGNDAALTLAEGVAGSEGEFVAKMNAAGAQMGLTRSHFTNATGFEDPAQLSTARDLAVLAQTIIRTYPEYYSIFSQPGIDWNRIKQRNRNVLLSANIGADGLQVGWLKEAGYHALGSAVRGNHHLVVVTLGAKTEKQRLDETRKLLDWGFDSFKERQLFPGGAEIARAQVFGGEQTSVPLVAHGPVELLVSRGSQERISAKVVYRGPLRAPVASDVEVGRLEIYRGTTKVLEVPLFTAREVGPGTLVTKARDGVFTLFGDSVRSGVHSLVAMIRR